MIYFITNKPEYNQVTEEEGILEVKTSITKEEEKWLIDLPIIGFDLETNELDPYTGSILLVILGNKEHQYVFDAITYDCTLLFNKFSDDKVYLAANGKFDYKFVKWYFGKVIKKIFDVMIAEQRLIQGTGLSSSLGAIVERRLGIIMNKDIRQEFVHVNPKTFKFKNKHIIYGAGDINKLFDIRDKQKKKIAERGMEFLIYHIEFPLIRRLADIEMEGIEIHEDKWRDILKSNKEKRFKSEIKLDEELRMVREWHCLEDDLKYISGGIWDRQRTKTPEVEQIDLFGEISAPSTKSKAKSKSAFINYSSTDVLLNIFGRLGQPAPTANPVTKESGPYIIPQYVWKSTKTQGKFVVDKTTPHPYRFTTGKGSIESYLIEVPSTPIKEFIKELVEYRKHCTRINTFGESFLKKYKNKVTGRYHTVYRQCHAVTGRLQSGDKKNNLYNSQNIPKDIEYRECFYSGTDYISTTDLSGAEAVIMIDKAKDEKFYEIAIKKDDAHSPFATMIWNLIGKTRMKLGINRNNHDKTPLELATMIVTKKENKDVRTLFKNVTFAIIYRAGKKKVGKMLNIDVDEAGMGIQVMRNTIPKTFKMIDENVRFALNNGYLILNERTKSRIWYPEILKWKQIGQDPPGGVLHEVTNSAANSPIQGTQADMMKEAIVYIMDEADRQDIVKKYNFAILKQVHDEIVHRQNNIEVKIEFRNDNGEIEMVTIPEFVKKWMSQVSNRYLSFIIMPAEQITLKTWTK